MLGLSERAAEFSANVTMEKKTIWNDLIYYIKAFIPVLFGSLFHSRVKTHKTFSLWINQTSLQYTCIS